MYFCSDFFSSENRTVYEKMWKTVVEPDRTQDDMGHVHCMLDFKVTNTQTLR